MARAPREPAPPELLLELERELEQGHLRRGYVLRGDEPWFRERALDFVRARAEARGDEVCSHDPERAGDCGRSRVVDDLSGGGLFSARRLIVLRQPEELLRKGDELEGSILAALLRFLAAPGDPGSVVLIGSLRADHAALKAVRAAGGRVHDFRRLYDSPPHWSSDSRRAELVEWLLSRARAKGVPLDAERAVYACAALGNDLGELDQLLEKLARSPATSAAEWRALVGWDAATSPWSVSDALLDGELTRALAGIESAFRSGFQEKSGRRSVDPTAVTSVFLAALARGARIGHALSRALEGGAAEVDALRAARAGGPPRAVQAALARARRRPARRWHEFQEELATLERASKSGGSVGADDLARLALSWSGVRSFAAQAHRA
jgi:DNA polymerase III delta subunit